jgi:hypothetical protein
VLLVILSRTACCRGVSMTWSYDTSLRSFVLLLIFLEQKASSPAPPWRSPDLHQGGNDVAAVYDGNDIARFYDEDIDCSDICFAAILCRTDVACDEAEDDNRYSTDDNIDDCCA